MFVNMLTMKRSLFIAAILVVISIVISVIIWVLTSEMSSGYSLNISGINTSALQYLAIAMSGNFSASRIVHVEGVKVRDLRPVEGVFIYNTSVAWTSKGPMYEVYIYNVTRINETTWIIVKIIKAHLGNLTPSCKEIFLVKNSTVYRTRIVAGNIVINRANVTIPPTCSGALSVLVAPPLWKYVAKSAKWKVFVYANTTYRLANMLLTFSQKTVEEDKVVGISSCNGPSGKCYIVKSRILVTTSVAGTINKAPISKELNCILYIDAKTGIVTRVKMGSLDVRLVKWTLKGQS